MGAARMGFRLSQGIRAMVFFSALAALGVLTGASEARPFLLGAGTLGGLVSTIWVAFEKEHLIQTGP